MRCPNKDCMSKRVRVLETSGPSHINPRRIRDYAEINNLNPEFVVMRRRICLDCGERFATFEFVVDD